MLPNNAINIICFSAIHCEEISVMGMHINVRAEGTRLGHKALFQCPVGFRVSGEANVTCQASGKTKKNGFPHFKQFNLSINLCY